MLTTCPVYNTEMAGDKLGCNILAIPPPCCTGTMESKMINSGKIAGVLKYTICSNTC